MALVLADRVQETTTTTGTGSLTLAGAVSGFQSFAIVGNTNTCYYTIVDGTTWEVGIGTYATAGPTLARTTVLANSSGNTSPITLSAGSKSVFLTYPAEKSVNLDGSGNASPLGTIASGTWNGSTVGVAYGGTGVTASSGANSVVLRDSNGNISANNVFAGFTDTATTGGTTTLTVASTSYQRFTGTLAQTVKLPDATTLSNGFIFIIDDDSTQDLTVTDAASTTIDTIYAGGIASYVLVANGTVAGTWVAYGQVPSAVDWGTDTLRLSNTVVTGGFWQGGTVQPAYGGTGITTFVAANNALYSSGAATLTAGTLPVLAGGTGVTTSTGSGANALATSPTLVTPILGTPTSGNLANCTFPTLNQNTTGTAANVTGTVAIANGGTGAITAPLALTALGAYAASNPSGYTTNTGTVTSITAGTGLSGGAITTSGTIALANTAVTAGSYTATNLTVDAQGRITAAASGTGGVTSVTGTAPIVSSGGTTPAISMAAASSGVNGYMTGTYATKLDGIATGATNVTNTNQLTNGAGFITSAGTATNVSGIVAVANGGTGASSAGTALTNLGAQATLVSGTNIKTVNSTSLLGAGNITVAASPAGSANQVQYNSAGAFAGSANFTYNGTTLSVTSGTSGVSTGIVSANGDMTSYRTGGTTGVIYLSSSGSNYLYWDATNYNLNGGNLVVTGNITANSDETLKTNWRPVAEDFVEQLAKIKHGIYDRLDMDATQAGVSAQAFQKLLPEVVGKDEHGKLTMTYGNAAMVSAIKLAERVVELEARLAALEK